MNLFTIHEYRDRAARIRELIDVWFDDEALHPARDQADAAVQNLQQAIELLQPLEASISRIK